MATVDMVESCHYAERIFDDRASDEVSLRGLKSLLSEVSLKCVPVMI